MRLCNRVMRAVRGYSFGHAVARHAVSRTSIGYFIGWTLRSDDVTAQHRMQRGYAALNTAAGPHLVLLNSSGELGDEPIRNWGAAENQA